jgi:hypothetical protein
VVARCIGYIHTAASSSAGWQQAVSLVSCWMRPTALLCWPACTHTRFKFPWYVRIVGAVACAVAPAIRYISCQHCCPPLGPNAYRAAGHKNISTMQKKLTHDASTCVVAPHPLTELFSLRQPQAEGLSSGCSWPCIRILLQRQCRFHTVTAAGCCTGTADKLQLLTCKQAQVWLLYHRRTATAAQSAKYSHITATLLLH